ncbi:phosphatase PAP2 family protein [Micromonospora lupini]|uniref:phosphatase PAP2 family protein n=1 Tax=Micromonospora lupini TaxID=285679 RepID=UPI0022535DC9|nr:phosphatase PAP2 family protein [Micromonospora lupini]MCX5065552.1 phosphatase PAP2 family protein [Micromonospora lupini]
MSHGSSYPVGLSSPGPARTLPSGRAAVPPCLRLLGAAVSFLLALALTGVLFVWTDQGQWIDGLLLPRAERGGGYEQASDLIGPAETVLATFGSPTLLAVLLGAVLAVGLLGRRLLAGVAGVGTVLCAVATAGAVKSALPRPDFAIEGSTSHNSFPSGHVAVATALVLAFLLVVPGWARRWLVVPGAAGVSVIGAATMIAGWHRFSDVLGGVLLSVALFCLAAAALTVRRGGDASQPRATPVVGRAWRAVGEGAVGLIVLGWVVRVLVPGLAASLPWGPLVAVLAAAGLSVVAVGVAVFLVRSVEFVGPLGPPQRQRPAEPGAMERLVTTDVRTARR